MELAAAGSLNEPTSTAGRFEIELVAVKVPRGPAAACTPHADDVPPSAAVLSPDPAMVFQVSALVAFAYELTVPLSPTATPNTIRSPGTVVVNPASEIAVPVAPCVTVEEPS